MDPELLIACLCADWCTTCQAYEATFKAVARAHPQARFVWIDIEQHSDTLGDAALDIESFPTLLLLRGSVPLFYGTVLPHAGTLDRMVSAVGQHDITHGQVDVTLSTAVRQLSRQLPRA